ncbi:MAG TPA: hypothetical protein VGP47_05165 [Parachlamydiaceae bacterium]|nr:hypothetical protein [Parachlamydiaceae bacterium]
MGIAISLDTAQQTSKFLVSESVKTVAIAAVSIFGGMVVRYLSSGVLSPSSVDAIIPVAIQVSFIASKVLNKIIQKIGNDLGYIVGDRLKFLTTVGTFIGLDRLISLIASRHIFDLPIGPLAGSNLTTLATGAMAWLAGVSLFESLNAPIVEVAIHPVRTHVPVRAEVIETEPRKVTVLSV